MQPRFRDRARIFISVAAFSDPMLIFTIRNALETASHPGRLAFGIVDQRAVSVERELPVGDWRMAYLLIDPHHSRGACWARSLAMSLYADEDYFFQIDSHTCFDHGWDVTLIETMERLSHTSGNDKLVVSTRPFGFEIDADGKVTTNRFTQSTIRLVPKERVLKLSDPVMKFAAYNSKQDLDLQGFQISAAFLFTRGQFVEEVPYDPFLYFHGEEQDISIRAFTRGWDIWHPRAVPLYHLYKTRADGEAPLHWDAVFEARRQEKWVERKLRANRRLADLICNKQKGVYGLGTEHSIEDYFAFGGLKLEA